MSFKSWVTKKVMGNKSDMKDVAGNLKTVADGNQDWLKRYEAGVDAAGAGATKLGEKISNPYAKVGLKTFGAAVKYGKAADEGLGKVLEKTGLGNEGIGGDKRAGSQLGRAIFERKNKEVLEDSRKEKSYAPSNGKKYIGDREVSEEEFQKWKAEKDAKKAAEEQQKSEGAPDSAAAGEATQDGAQGDAEQADGAQGDGAQADGAQADGAQADGAQADGAQADGAQADGAQADGAQGDGAQADGAQADGAQADGAQADGAQADGAQADGAQSDGGATADAGDEQQEKKDEDAAA